MELRSVQALITGGSSGIGRAVALELADAGADAVARIGSRGWSARRGHRTSTTPPRRPRHWPRTLEPPDVSGVVLSLLGADGVTGETVVVDGGRAIRY